MYIYIYMYIFIQHSANPLHRPQILMFSKIGKACYEYHASRYAARFCGVHTVRSCYMLSLDILDIRQLKC